MLRAAIRMLLARVGPVGGMRGLEMGRGARGPEMRGRKIRDGRLLGTPHLLVDPPSRRRDACVDQQCFARISKTAPFAPDQSSFYVCGEFVHGCARRGMYLKWSHVVPGAATAMVLDALLFNSPVEFRFVFLVGMSLQWALEGAAEGSAREGAERSREGALHRFRREEHSRDMVAF